MPRWITRKCTIEFLTPAFLGGAEQSGQWRTPPFKALLRQWWRVVYAAGHQYQVDLGKMREEEGRLFGNAWLEKEANGRKETAASRSLVRLRLSRWEQGGLRSWQNLDRPPVRHPEVPQPVGPHLYLGYGPLTYDRQQQQTALKAPPCVDVGERAEFQIACPEDQEAAIRTTLALLDRYGAAGGRSRNGWGSFHLIPADGAWPALNLPLRDWRQALELDWPHCIGKDEAGPLIWRTVKEYGDWKELMRDLACLKIAVRTQFQWSGQTPDQRHWLAYPVTNHGVPPWGNQARLPNQLRFKVRCVDADPKRLIGVVYHMPCQPPPSFAPAVPAVVKVWEQVHTLLDKLGKPAGQRRLPSSLNGAVIHQLAQLMLQRIPE